MNFFNRKKFKVKSFNNCVYYPRYEKTEEEVNKYILDNPQIEVIDVVYQMNRVIDGNEWYRETYIATCILKYKE